MHFVSLMYIATTSDELRLRDIIYSSQHQIKERSNWRIVQQRRRRLMPITFFLHINFEQWKCQIFLWSSFYLVCLFRNCKVILSEKFQFRPFWSILVLIHKNNLITRESLNQSGILEEAQVFLLCLGLISSITFQFGDLGQVSLIFTKKFRTVWWLLERSDQREK